MPKKPSDESVIRKAAEDLVAHQQSQYLKKNSPEAYEAAVQDAIVQLQQADTNSKPWQY